MVEPFKVLYDTLSESVPKKSKKELRFYEKIPVWICEYHQEVLPHIYRAIGSKHLPFVGITMVHFDSHPDLMAPADLQADCAYDKDLLFDVVSIADWILPGVYVGHFKKVIWIKPPWSHQIEDKTIVCQVGRHKRDGTIRVSSCQQYFCEDGLYAPLEELENCKELILVVMTMYFNDFPTCDLEKLEQKSVVGLSTNVSCVPTNTCNTRKDISKLEHFIEGLSTQLEEPFILDIDMDFFSTLNPFQVMFTKEEFQVLRNFYLFPRCNPGVQKDMDEASKKHGENIKDLEATLDFLKSGSDDKSNHSINVEFMAFIKKLDDSHSMPVDYEMVHSAGMTTELPVHVTDKQEIIKMMNHVQKILTFLPKPTIITVARSSDDDYTPPESVEMIQVLLMKCLKETYKEDSECFLSYRDE